MPWESYWLCCRHISTSQAGRFSKRLSANIDTGDFSGGEYDRQLERDFNNLCIYDNLIRLDVKEYYGRIYTHNIDFNGHGERYLSNMNCGETNGLLMGNYISLYFAESILSKISVSIENMLMEQNIDCIFSYFSDDFYFFCNKEDNDGIISIFDKVLEPAERQRHRDRDPERRHKAGGRLHRLRRLCRQIGRAHV